MYLIKKQLKYTKFKKNKIIIKSNKIKYKLLIVLDEYL
jgi:hypothetical protein